MERDDAFDEHRDLVDLDEFLTPHEPLDAEPPPADGGAPPPPDPPEEPPRRRGGPGGRRVPPGDEAFLGLKPMLVTAVLLVCLGLVQMAILSAGAQGGEPMAYLLSFGFAVLFLGPFYAGSFWMGRVQAADRAQGSGGLPSDGSAR